MVNSVGKKLQESRVNKQLSIEDAARVTRIRPDKLLDLEDDNYSNFPSLSYAKGFLLIYSRYLGVDVREFAESLHSSNPVSTDDYEYLNAAADAPPPPPTRRPYHFAPRRERTLLPVIVFAVLTGIVGFIIFLVVTFQRLGGNLEDIADKKDLSSPTASPSAISTLPAATPIQATPPPIAVAQSTPVATPSAKLSPAFISTPPAAQPIAAAPAPTAPIITTPPANPAATFDPTREVRRAEAVGASPAPHAQTTSTNSVTLPAVGSGPAVTSVEPGAAPADDRTVKQVSILPIRKTMVTIRKDVADSAPIFEDFLYPGDGPLKVSGRKLWIQVQDPGAVQITQDGQPVPAGRSDIQIE
jgi:cytoskeletal protein RodZ